MAEIYTVGETKIRPGAYFNIQKKGDSSSADVISGVTAVIFRADFGPLNKAVELAASDGYASVYGTGGRTDAIQEAINGSAKTIIACRVGSGGSEASAILQNTSETDALTITANYPGAKEFTVTIKTKLSDSTVKQCIIYSGTTEFVKVEFIAGTGEATALKEALEADGKFSVTISTGMEEAELALVTQVEFIAGTDPDITSEDYSNAFSAVEPYDFNTICVDTEDTAVLALLQAFVDRIFDAGSMSIAVVAETHDIDLETRMSNAAAYNDEKVVYILNAYVSESGTAVDGYQTAARIAGLIGAAASTSSLTHTVINGFTEILEPLTNTQITNAEKSGCVVLTYNSEKQVWIDYGINTLITPADNQDDGWKKIRRVKTRFELMQRCNTTADNLVGKIDNDNNGRMTLISQLQAVGDAMISEGKLTACTVTESSTYTADGDSAWFDIDVIDKDSMEHIYLTYYFRFSTSAE